VEEGLGAAALDNGDSAPVTGVVESCSKKRPQDV
jgi:hypothetical protein